MSDDRTGRPAGNAAVRRFGSVIGLRPERAAEYLALHRAVWPTVLALIEASNIRNYSIYRHGDLLFSYYEYVGSDYEADMERMAADPETQRWWDACKPCQLQTDDAGPGEWWTATPEIFHCD
jgi:L-rhamnose mutarotase